MRQGLENTVEHGTDRAIQSAVRLAQETVELTPIGRGVGITEFLHGSAPWLLVVLFSLVTQLGDVWFLFLLAGTMYIGGETVPRIGVSRREGLFVLGLVVTYIALIGVLKNFFLLPRPPDAAAPPELRWIPEVLAPAFTSTTTGEGPGFPSGHALGTTMVWGGVALVVDRGTNRLRLALAAAVVAVVSLSRLVIGVHYAVDVVVGAALGAAVLAALYRLTDGGASPERVLYVAVGVGAIGALSAFSFDGVAALGGAVGGWLAWEFVAERTPAHPDDRRETAAAFAVGVLASAVFVLVYAYEPGLPLTFVGTAAAVAIAVSAPMAGDRLA